MKKADCAGSIEFNLIYMQHTFKKGLSLTGLLKRLGLASFTWMASVCVSWAQSSLSDPCDSLVPALVGGAIPTAQSDTAVLRWLGNANYEIAYKGKVYLLDTYYDRKARSRSLGFTVPEVKKADLIMVGHAHFDHIADIGPVSVQTGARVVGSAITIETAKALGMPPSAAVEVQGGDQLELGELRLDVALARHSTIQNGLIEAYANLYKIEVRADTPEEAQKTRLVMSRGSNDPRIIDQGTLAYGLTFRNGFKLVIFGSAGPITPGAEQMAQKMGPVDVAIVSYQPHAVSERQVMETMPLVQLFKPKLLLPAHHDASFGTWIDLGLEPLFEKVREVSPSTRFLAPLYRSPICIATSGDRRGQVIQYTN